MNTTKWGVSGGSALTFWTGKRPQEEGPPWRTHCFPELRSVPREPRGVLGTDVAAGSPGAPFICPPSVLIRTFMAFKGQGNESLKC